MLPGQSQRAFAASTLKLPTASPAVSWARAGPRALSGRAPELPGYEQREPGQRPPHKQPIRTLTITGTAAQVGVAKELVEATVKEEAAYRRGLGLGE